MVFPYARRFATVHPVPGERYRYPMSIPKNEQIEAILKAKEWDLARKYGLNEPSEIKWTISKEEVLQFVEHNGFPKGWVGFKRSVSDGLYVLEDGAEWTVYYQERGAIHYEDRFNSRNEATDFLLENYYLKRFGIS